MRKTISALAVLLTIVLGVTAARGEDVPGWLQAAAKAELPAHTDSTEAVVLYEETTVTVKDNGEWVTSGKVAYKILRPGGEKVATLVLPYDDETKINNVHGWCITPGGRQLEAKDKDAVEVGSFSGLYADDRKKVLLPPGAEVGSVVGYEYEQRDRPYLFQDSWQFQRPYPVRRSVYTVNLPNGWEYRVWWANHAEVAPVVDKQSITWSVTDVPAVEKEPAMPHFRAVAGRMNITFISPQANFRDRSQLSWADMGSWYWNLVSDRRTPTTALQAKVTELTAGKTTTLEKIQALARYAQKDIRYVAIEIGIGGHRPHTAAEIFGSRYGDCKDKAILLSTMLKQIGVDSDYVVIHTDRGIVTRDAPPAITFNHAILAIALPPEVKESFPATVETKSGRFLIFDPTDEMTPLGVLPPELEDNYALLVTAGGGELIHLPMFSPNLNQLQRTGHFKLGPDGSLSGEVQEVRTGALARDERYRLQALTDAERTKDIEARVNRFIGAVSLQDFGVENLDDPDKDLVTHYKFWSPKYGKVAGPLLLLRPRLFGEKTEDVLTEKERKYPFSFEAPTLQTDIYEYQLPDGFTVDELPDPTKAEMVLGDYSSKVEQKGNILRYERRYELKGVTLPASEELNLKKFYTNITVDERANAVLKRAP